MSSWREKIVQSIRPIAVIVTGGCGAVLLSLLTVQLIRTNIAKGEDLASLAASLLGCLLIGGIFIALCCLAVFHAFSFWRSTSLKKAIRLVEALQMLGAQTHKERIEAIRHNNLRIFKTKTELPPDISEAVQCKEISTFLSPMFFTVDRLNALGSPYYCCDYDQIQSIIAANREKWGILGEQSGETAVSVIALERALADMREKYTKVNKECSGAKAREGKLKKQLEEVKDHMVVLIELTNKITNEVKPPKTIIKAKIKEKYLAIGKIYGITTAPVDYVELFRKTMPQEIIHGDGPPTQNIPDDMES